jgi:thiol:disulfide interchange protein DsbD
MMDVIEWDPQALIDRILRPKVKDPRKQNYGYTNAFVLGATSGFIAAPCTTPVLASILAFIARSQSVEFGFVLMLAFSLGLGTLLLAIALSASLIERLPRSGAWMKKVKVGSGVLLLLFAEYLIFRAGVAGGLTQ